MTDLERMAPEYRNLSQTLEIVLIYKTWGREF